LNLLVEGLLKNKSEKSLVELDLQRCTISDQSIAPLVKLLN